jgi:hypothetical protein
MGIKRVWQGPRYRALIMTPLKMCFIYIYVYSEPDTVLHTDTTSVGKPMKLVKAAPSFLIVVTVASFYQILGQIRKLTQIPFFID